MLTFVKLGGSLLTDKTVESSFRQDVAERVALELKAALTANPDLQVLLGHGSGSFGHFAAKKYNTMAGVHSADEWRGFASVATAASALNYLVADTLHTHHIPVWRLQPSASAVSVDGVIQSLAVAPITAALQHGLVPLIYGDVALDQVRGGTIISTESIFFYLAQQLPVQQILLLGEVDGVYDQNGAVIPHINPANFTEIASALGGSAGVDVTGGMETKVSDMLSLTQKVPDLKIRIMSGRHPGLLQRTLLGEETPGTLISA